jgi:hypothetical protein
MLSLRRCLRDVVTGVALLVAGCEDGGPEAESVDHDHGPTEHDDDSAPAGADRIAFFQEQAAALHDHGTADVEHDHEALPEPTLYTPADFPSIESLPPGWTAIAPGGDTICARGDRYMFLVRPGSVNRVVLEFQGGGGCWDESTCTPGAQVFSERADLEPFVSDPTLALGLRDHSDARNPFRDWHHVFVPYCTGDQHRGDVARSYGSGDQRFTVHHRGAVNVRAVLEWMYGAVTDPEKALVTGCSAGAMGSILWSAYVREHYEHARVYQFGDSNSGVLPGNHDHSTLDFWGERDSFPPFIEATADPYASARLYGAIGKHFPDMPLSQFTTNYDYIQWLYHFLGGGGDVEEWTTNMRAIVAETSATTPNYRSFIGPGSNHCVLPDAGFYTAESNGTLLLDWLSDLVEDIPVDHVDCGEDCGAPRMVPPSGS